MNNNSSSPREIATICDSHDCTGCGACFNACACNAISMSPDQEGFLHPTIDAGKCIRCGKCVKVCPQNNRPRIPEGRKVAYACWNKDESVRNKSSSGGSFSAIAEVIISMGGVVYGAAFDESNTVCHIRVGSTGGLSRLQRSKYVQSAIGTVFREIKKNIEKGIPVLFSGTPCQVAGLYAFLGERHEDILRTVDFACHGVNSPKVFSDYIAWLGKKRGKPVKTIEFRNKDHGWHAHEVVASFEDGFQIRQRPSENAFFNGFLKHLYLRPSCSQCPYACLSHPADITLADFWGYKGFSNLDEDDNRGVSAAIVNTETGGNLFWEAASNLEVFHRKIDEIARYNAALRMPSPASLERRAFWRNYRDTGFADTLVAQYLTAPPDATPPDRRPPKRSMTIKIKGVLKKTLKSVLGTKFCHEAKRLFNTARGCVKKTNTRLRRFLKVYFADRITLFFTIKIHSCVFVFVSPGHTNLGDNAQTLCIRELLKQRYPHRKILFFTNDYIRETNLKIVPFVKRISKPTDPVFLHSGYRMSDVWLPSNRLHEFVVQTFDDRPIVSFPQTIYYREKAVADHTASIFNAHPDNTLMCRDAVSFETAKRLFSKCKLMLVPDVVTSKIGQYRFKGPRHGILVCKRNDRESACGGEDFARILTELSRLDEVTVSDTYAKDSWKTMHRDLKRYLEDVWKEYAKYRLVITDRYHGTIFSLIAATPVLVFPSTDHKVATGLDWFPESFSDYVQFVPNPADIPAAAKAMLGKKLDHILLPYFKERFFDNLFKDL